jgi:AcrR family transcriptional regulator
MAVTSTDRSARRGRPPKGAAQLSREAILDATLTAIDTLGVSVVSMRGVAKILGVDAKSLYNHVEGKDDLLDAVAEHILGTVVIPCRTGNTREDLRAIAHAFRAGALAHPEAATLVLTRQVSSPAGLAPTEAVLQVLDAAGFSPDESVPLLRMLVATLTGTLLRELQAGPAFGVGAGIAEREAALTTSGLPFLARAAARIARFDRQAEFEFTINAVIDAVLIRHR